MTARQIIGIGLIVALSLLGSGTQVAFGKSSSGSSNSGGIIGKAGFGIGPLIGYVNPKDYAGKRVLGGRIQGQFQTTPGAIGMDFMFYDLSSESFLGTTIYTRLYSFRFWARYQFFQKSIVKPYFGIGASYSVLTKESGYLIQTYGNPIGIHGIIGVQVNILPFFAIFADADVSYLLVDNAKNIQQFLAVSGVLITF